MTEKIYDNRWKVIESLGEGGQGKVYKVEDQTGQGIFVLKRLKNIARLDRFKTEIAAIAKMEHPNIVRLVHHALEVDKPYLVTDYYEGGELTFEKVRNLSALERLKLFRVICNAVGHAHTKGIVHRDIKPPNILLQNAHTPVVADFGIAFDTEDGVERITLTVEQVGARYFMAPELRDGRTNPKDITAQCDVYSLGKLLYWMFAGRVMDRENFAESDWDLRPRNSFDHTFHFLTELFEQTIVLRQPIRFSDAKSDRLLDANEFANRVDAVIDILERDGRFSDPFVPQRCLFCKQGTYKRFAIPMNQQGVMLGLQGNLPSYDDRGYSQSFCFSCERCGNIQFFNLANSSKGWKTPK